MRHKILALCLMLAPGPFASAQDALELLNKVQAMYFSLPRTTYDFEQIQVDDSGSSTSMRHETRQHIRSIGSAGKYREENDGRVYVVDGEFRWTYNKDTSEYMKQSFPAALIRVNMATSLVSFQIVAYRVKRARFVRQETLELDSGLVACQVIEVEREARDDGVVDLPTTYWIDPARNLILKLRSGFSTKGPGETTTRETTRTVTFRKASVGQPVEEALLRFTPAPDDTQVEQFTYGAKSPLLGAAAPDFELQDVDGKAITKDRWTGSPVLLQFSPYPDDDSLFRIELTHRSLVDKGLKAVYVLQPRSRSGGRDKSYTVPVAIDLDGSAAKKFGIRYSGTVLIGRDGKVAYVDTLSGYNMALFRALQKAGIW